MKILCNNKIIADDVRSSSGLKGLMFSKKLKQNQAIIIKRKKESIKNSSVHMLFVFQKLKMIWLNKNKEIVDIRNAYPFVSFLSPKKPAKYIIELNSNKKLEINQKLDF